MEVRADEGEAAIEEEAFDEDYGQHDPAAQGRRASPR